VEVPIERARAVIRLPAASPASVRTRSRRLRVAGVGGPDHTVGTTLTVETTRALNFREGVTVAIAWTSHRGASDRGRQDLGFLLANVALLIRSACSRDVLALARHGGIRAASPWPCSTSRPGAHAGELGTLVDNSPDMRDITATVVDLAVRGSSGSKRPGGSVLGLGRRRSTRSS